MIGSVISDYVLDDRAKDLYIKSINSNSTEVSETESLFKRKDNSQFIGLITMVSTRYNESEVSHVLINKADILLYKAKNRGRNRVENGL